MLLKNALNANTVNPNNLRGGRPKYILNQITDSPKLMIGGIPNPLSPNIIIPGYG
jgi:hypothetical protein